MAEQLKQVAKFSEDAISMACNTLTEEQWEHFRNGLDIITQNLGEKKENRNKSKPRDTKLSDEVIFKEHLLTQIRQRLVEVEKDEVEKLLAITVDFTIRTDFTRSSIEDILEEHVKIVHTEEGLKAMTLFAQFSRGLLYLTLTGKLKEKRQTLREFVEGGNLNVSYTTVLRYMTLATIILKYPRLLLCQLNFTQIMKHKKRLLDFLSLPDGHDLHCRLTVPFEIIANGHKINIEHGEIKTLTEKFNTSADWMFHDVHNRATTTDEQVKTVVASLVMEDEEADLKQIMDTCHL